MSKPIIAIIGRPNVGKSTLFNKLAGERIAIVDDTPGVTRDRIYTEVEWNGRTLLITDTGGIEPKTYNEILQHMRRQAEIAIDMANVVVFMVDSRAGLTADDVQIARMLQKAKKPVVVAVNKIDSVGNLPMEYYEFYELGFPDDPVALSSVSGTGTGDLLDAILEKCPDDDGMTEEDDSIKVAVIGKPNAGKSSIVNKIIGQNRMIVSDIPGTTRDAVDAYIENDFGKYTFIDTAGIRRQSKISDNIERYSVLRAKAAVDRADVCLIMIDAAEGITEQDEKIAGIAHEAGKASIIVVNKWDKVEKDNSTVKEFTDRINTALSYMTYAPIIFVSALTGQRLNKLFEHINYVYGQATFRATTGMLNDLLNDATTRVQPPSDKGRRLKIYYMTQTAIQPTTFVIFCNNSTLFHFSYQRYIENRLRETFGFRGVPIKLIIRERGE